MKQFCLIFLACFLLQNNLKAQSCLENIYTASKLLDAGKADECIQLVRPCSMNAQEPSTQWQAFRLLSISHLLKGMSDSAKADAENMLNINPTYEPSLIKDPKEFISLLQKIVVIPKFSIGLALSAGSNSTFPRISQAYAVAKYNKNYISQNGFQLGTQLGFYLTPRWVLELGINADNKRYKVEYSINDWKINIRERLTYLETPLTVKYIIHPVKSLRFYAIAGVYSGLLLYGQNDFHAEFLPDHSVLELNSLDNRGRRNGFNYGATGGLGLSVKSKQGHISFQVNYFRSLSKINIDSKRYDYTEQVFNYYYVDDDIFLDNITLNIGYTFYLNYKVYKTKKK